MTYHDGGILKDHAKLVEKIKMEKIVRTRPLLSGSGTVRRDSLIARDDEVRD